MTETVVEPMTSKEEAELLKEWFDTVQFDVESDGIPPLKPERDDEESRNVLMAQAIEEWFAGPPSMEVPFVDSEGAWDLVDFTNIHMSRSTAKEFMDSEYEFQKMLDESRINVNHSKKDGKFAKGPGTGATNEPALSNRKADDLAERVQTPDGGFTVDPRTGKDIKEGFAVAMFPERSREIPHKDVDREALQKYTKDNADVLSQPGNMMGGWHDPDSGTVWLDVSKVTTDKREAIDLAKQHNQIAIFDLGSGNSINTGGTGRSSYPFVFTRANPYHSKTDGKFASKNGGTGLIKAAATYDELSPAGKKAVVSAETKAGVTRAGMSAEIDSKINDANIAEGRAWYTEAQTFNNDLATRSGLSIEQTAAITSALSPQTPWPRNKQLAEKVAMTHKDYDGVLPTHKDRHGKLDTPAEAAGRKMGGTLSKNSGVAFEIARGGSIDEHLTGVKRRSFYNNMVDPKNSKDITIDTWMARAAMHTSTKEGGLTLDEAQQFVNSSKKVTGGGAGYVSISESVREVARRRNLTPHEVQAAYWIAVSGSKNGAWGD